MINTDATLDNLALRHYENVGELPNIADRLLFDADRAQTEWGINEIRANWTIADCLRLLTK